MKQEFESKIGKEIDHDSWCVINTVYTFHPSIDEVCGKQQIADLYMTFGMTIIFDMKPRAEQAEVLEGRKASLKMQLAKAEAELAALTR